MSCLGCFKLTKDIYCSKCKKELFDNQKIDFKLDFDKKEFLSTKIELSDKMSISGVQDKIALKIEDNKLIPTIKDSQYLLKPIPLMDYGELLNGILLICFGMAGLFYTLFYNISRTNLDFGLFMSIIQYIIYIPITVIGFLTVLVLLAFFVNTRPVYHINGR